MACRTQEAVLTLCTILVNAFPQYYVQVWKLHSKENHLNTRDSSEKKLINGFYLKNGKKLLFMFMPIDSSSSRLKKFLLGWKDLC